MATKTAGAKKKVFRKKEKKNIPVGIAYIAASFNNTMISITDLEGNLIAQSSSGARGFRGPRKPGCSSAKCVSRVRAVAASQPSARSITPEFASRQFVTSRQFRTTGVG